MSSRRAEPCAFDNCGSRRFHVGDDGYTYCHRGHQQSEQGAIIAEDTGELVITGRRTRRRGDSDAESQASLRAAQGFSGPRAFEHYLLCLQLVLRKQVRWLVERQGLPGELETLVRDLWALRLQKLQARVSVSYESATDTEGQSQMFSSQSEGETSGRETPREKSRKSKDEGKDRPNLDEMLVLCYLGCVLLREPVTVADLHGWVVNGHLLYHRTTKEVPLSMRERLPGTYQDLLEPQDVMPPQRLHRKVQEVLALFDGEFGMTVPEVNHTLLLYCWTKRLALPIEVFAATQRLARILELNFFYALGPQEKRIASVLRSPEMKLMALIVLATKLVFPLDDHNRAPFGPDNLSALVMDWTVWAEQMQDTQAADSDKRLDFKSALNMSAEDVLAASEDKLDEYLDWYETNVMSDEIRERGQHAKDATFRRTLHDMFPVSDNATQKTVDSETAAHAAPTHIDRLRNVQAALKTRRTIPAESSAEEPPRSGSFHRRYRTVDELVKPARTFYSRAAEVAGMSLDALVQAVFALERRIERLQEAQRLGSNG